MATQIIGSLAINNILPTQARGAGTASWGPVAVPAGYSFLTVQFDLTQLVSLTPVLTAAVSIALDGVNFVPGSEVGLDLSVSGYVLNGSVVTRASDDPLGTGPVRVFGATFRLPSTELTTRKVQGTLQCSEAVTSGVTLMAY